MARHFPGSPPIVMKKIFTWLVPALVSGGLTGLAFPKVEFALLGWVSLLPLLWVLTRKGRTPGFRAGWAAGSAFYAVLLYWIPAVPKHFGGLSTGLSALIYLGFAMFLGLFWAWPSAVFTRIRRRFPCTALWMFPCLWVASEWALTHVLTGFPWGLLGSTQYRNLWFIQLSAIFGVYGLSWILVFFQSAAIGSIRTRRMGMVIGALALAALVHGGGFLTLRSHPVEKEGGFRAAVVQGNISADIDFSRLSLEDTTALLNRHIRLSRQAVQKGARLIIWPELSVPFCFSCEYGPYPIFEDKLRSLAASTGATFVLGTNEVFDRGNRPLFFNTSACLAPDGTLSFYHKTHLVPFGEYTPLKKLFSFISNFTQAIGELTPGDRLVLHSARGVPFGTPICYEIVFPSLVRSFTRRGAEFLVTITNDAWYGTSAAPHQHFAMAVLRAVENRRTLLRAATTGISGVIDPYGRILKQSSLQSVTMLTADVIPRDDRTLYVRTGNVLPLISLTLASVFFILTLTGRHEQRHSKSRSRIS